jgi:hypothetical protein
MVVSPEGAANSSVGVRKKSMARVDGVYKHAAKKSWRV